MQIPHELKDEFPREASFIERLRRENYDFRHLAQQYDAVNVQIHKIESEEEVTTDEVLERLKKQRLLLKDKLATFFSRLERRM